MLRPSVTKNHSYNGIDSMIVRAIAIFFLALLPCSFSALASDTTPTAGTTTSTASITARSHVAQVVDLFPNDIETLAVIRKPWVIPDNRPDPRVASNGFAGRSRDLQLSFVLDRDYLWEKISGNTVSIWVEGARHFRLPGINSVQPVIHDGCQVFVFKEDIPDALRNLFRALRGARGRRHMVGEIEVLEYVPRSLRLMPQGFSFWLASPNSKTLLIASDLSFLRSMLETKSASFKPSFPDSLPYWRYIDTNATAWGIRNYRNDFGETDISDARWHSDRDSPPGVSTGFVFQLNENHGEVVWFNCDHGMTDTLTKSVRARVSSNIAECRIQRDDGRLRVIVRWPEPKNEAQIETRRRIRNRIGSWLLWHLGHAAVV